MKRQIRRGVYETNSSMCHALSIVTEQEYKDWEDGELIFDTWDDKFITKEQLDIDLDEDEDDQYAENPEAYFDKYSEYFETYKKEFTTPSGDNMIAFGYYGHD